MSKPSLPTLSEILDAAGVNDWDLLLVGDGSGNRWNSPCGWACVLVERGRSPHLCYGGMSVGSNNLAEVMPYLQALTWYHDATRTPKRKRVGLVRVVVVTDSQLVVNHGTTAMDPSKALPTRHRAIWAAFREFGRCGYQIEFHYAPRNSSLWNQAADLVASLSRKALKNLTLSDGETTSEAVAREMDAISLRDPRNGRVIPLGGRPLQG